jgi:hypothetical protein
LFWSMSGDLNEIEIIINTSTNASCKRHFR